ncbi:LPS assembly lipoprotein LptE [Marinobacter sp. HL-58]|uniref:LPS-assembly lipoprotein LptE n=1 Tax=Marinobacter sp. HL-58 TaxID=1479237 RepID=UPI000484663E|nr:LPS assembly lipoprotein LptE [Marinobacter sp. HL-58]KPP99809.1 MAG: lipopolysaccharide export system outer membrane lipoprotein component LptE [Marinobacter sp. HL-58]
MKTAAGSLFRPLVAVILSLLMAGCGFQLRGAPPVSSALQPLAVDCSENVPGQLCDAVQEQLELGRIQLKPVEEADYVLRIGNFRQERRASAITLRAAAAEYTLRHSVDIEVITADRIPLIEPTDLNSSETFRYDESNVLAKQREEDALREQLHDRLAQQIIFRLAPLTEERIERFRQEAEESREESRKEDSEPSS